MIKMEVCCYNLESAVIAGDCGADRIELCDNSYQGGTTPSFGTIKTALSEVPVGVSVMIRPRGGDFLYSQREIGSMLHDIALVKDLGAEGVVFGCLRPDGYLDTTAMSELIRAAKPLKITLHRAFDLTKDPIRSLQEAISLGVDRILTSGQCQSAGEGMALIKELVNKAASEVAIMPGAGINEQNLKEVLNYTNTREFHVSAKEWRTSLMEYRTPSISMGQRGLDEYGWEVASTQRVKKFRSIADQVEEKRLI